MAKDLLFYIIMWFICSGAVIRVEYWNNNTDLTCPYFAGYEGIHRMPIYRHKWWVNQILCLLLQHSTEYTNTAAYYNLKM